MTGDHHKHDRGPQKKRKRSDNDTNKKAPTMTTATPSTSTLVSPSAKRARFDTSPKRVRTSGSGHPHQAHHSTPSISKTKPHDAPKTSPPSPGRYHYQCRAGGCKQSFSMKSNLVRHEKERHQLLEAQLFVCITCGDAFTRKSSLQRHEESRSHGCPGKKLKAKPSSSTPATVSFVPHSPKLPPEPLIELLPPPLEPTSSSSPHPTKGGKSLKLVRQLMRSPVILSSSTDSDASAEGVGHRLNQSFPAAHTLSSASRVEVTTIVSFYRGETLCNEEKDTKCFRMA